ncbi:MAG: PrgI family protein [Oscillospiraceae bacterium]|jgi:hypothetical protein|nr:PrgI family protein [Oscillospiraceae bacterium]
MAYVPVPKDLTKVKTKLAFNLTKRQLICFGGGALIGVPLFFLLRTPLGTSAAAMFMMLVMLPFFLLGVYEKHGQPLEKVLRSVLNVCFLRPRERPYKTNNFYAALERQNQLDMEVYRIVNPKAKTDPQRTQADRSRDCQGEGDG